KVPMMLAGEKNPTEDHWLDWATCCRTYFANKETVKAENYVINVAGGLKPRRVALWYQANHVELNKLTFEEFLTKCMTKWLPSTWQKTRQAKLLSITQGTGSFSDLANAMINHNSALSGSNCHLDDERLRTQLDLAMDPLLRAEVDENEKIYTEKDLDAWVDLVVIVDERRTREKEMRLAEVEEHARKIMTNDKKRSSTTAGFNNASRTGQNPNTSFSNTSSSNTSTSTTYKARPRLPQITESERALLRLNFGCTKCRQFFVNHNRTNCKNDFPSPVGYHTLTQ
ncbi:hypothetical protein IW261DRAFT_1314896, partial [Armillaria novae-zelandiae]